MASAASVFNDLILSYVIYTFNKLNLFPLFENGTTQKEIAQANDYEPKRLSELLAIAETMGVLKQKNERFVLTPLGQDIERNRGFFTWAVGGYSPLLENMDTFLTAPTMAWQPYVRGEYVAIGSDEANQGLMQDIFDRVIDGFDAKRIADLGCGNAGRLVDLLKRRSELTGVGIDINPQAIEVAQKNISQNGLTGKIDLVCENVFTSLTEPRPELNDVELVMSFMMLHDLFNIEELRGKLFTKMKEAFPEAKYFVFADTCLDEHDHDAQTMPVFTMGYELIHQMRGIQLFPVAYYREQFDKEGLKLIAQHEFGVPNTYLFILKVE